MNQDQYDSDAQVMRLYEQLVEIEQRLIPTGLHVFGRASELKEREDLLRMVASFDRPEHGVRALPKLIAEALGINSYDELLQETAALLPKNRCPFFRCWRTLPNNLIPITKLSR